MRYWSFLIKVILFVGTALVVLANSGQVAAEEPILQIETGTHNAIVGDAAVDAAGHVVVTVSDDKTARLWSLPDLHSLGVIRPDIAAGPDGSLYSVAMSSDGHWVAVGGYRSEVLLFDTETKDIFRRWQDLPSSVLSLAFSADGKQLAAGFGKQGIRV